MPKLNITGIYIVCMHITLIEGIIKYFLHLAKIIPICGILVGRWLVPKLTCVLIFLHN